MVDSENTRPCKMNICIGVSRYLDGALIYYKDLVSYLKTRSTSRKFLWQSSQRLQLAEIWNQLDSRLRYSWNCISNFEREIGGWQQTEVWWRDKIIRHHSPGQSVELCAASSLAKHPDSPLTETRNSSQRPNNFIAIASRFNGELLTMIRK